MSEERYKNFAEFYPFYLSEHQNTISRRLHVIGTGVVIIELLSILLFQLGWSWMWLLPLTGYGFAWVGHFFFEHNRPATFSYPLWSLRGDFTLFFEVVSGRRQVDASFD